MGESKDTGQSPETREKGLQQRYMLREVKMAAKGDPRTVEMELKQRKGLSKEIGQ